MENEKKPVSRQKFLYFGVSLAALFTLPSFLKNTKKTEKSKTVKMLTQDGQLVTIDVKNIPSKKKWIKTKDIHTWVNPNKSTL
jgi:hypothetical protein